MLDPGEIILLETSLNGGLIVQVVVGRCQFSCCGKGFRERTGYEQTYTGRIAHIELDGTGLTTAVRMNGLGMGQKASFIMEAAAQDIVGVRQRPRPDARYG